MHLCSMPYPHLILSRYPQLSVGPRNTVPGSFEVLISADNPFISTPQTHPLPLSLLTSDPMPRIKIGIDITCQGFASKRCTRTHQGTDIK